MTREEAARLLGMKIREIVAVASTPDGDVITNHVGNHTLVTAAGELVFGVDAPPAAPESGEDPVDDGDPVPIGALVTQVPDGSIAAVTDWVAGDPGKAAAALQVEQAREEPRKTLVTELTKLVTP